MTPEQRKLWKRLRMTPEQIRQQDKTDLLIRLLNQPPRQKTK